MGTIIDGKAVSSEIRIDLKSKAQKIHDEDKTSPSLAVILIGDNENSVKYVRLKNKACEEVGIKCHQYILPENIEESEVLSLLGHLNENPEVHGILVQLPLPEQFNEDKIISAIDLKKDVDGIHPENLGRLLTQQGHFFKPCTPAGCLELINRNIDSLEGKHVVIVGRGLLVGRPLAALLMQKKEALNCTVTVCNSFTKDLGYITLKADVLVAAAGVPKLITSEMIKNNAVVIDVGITAIEDPAEKGRWRLKGDVDFDNVKEKASAITPVPGGVGPMTITMLLANVIEAWQLQHS
jgi:methylenetetrahydrofolate dehydrogenase (NADP+)/methenyltetrahydrofolate cyclohydrolase